MRELAFRSTVWVFDRERPYVMGVVNATPDSFSDGGRLTTVAAAVAHGMALWQAGADVLDVGGEATNPRAVGVPAAVECERVLEVIAGLAAATTAIISIDTTKAEVARAAVAAGAEMINDVAGGLFDPGMAAVVEATGAAYVCGHLRGSSLVEVFGREGEAPVTVADVIAELRIRLAALSEAARARALVDPGLGFGKGDPATNLALQDAGAALGEALGLPVVVGPSRKRYLRRGLAAARRVPEATLTEAELDEATVAACLAAVGHGAQVLRVHNVALLRERLAMYTGT